MKCNSDEQDLGDEEESMHGKEGSEDSIKRSIWVLHSDEGKKRGQSRDEEKERIGGPVVERTCSEEAAT